MSDIGNLAYKLEITNSVCQLLADRMYEQEVNSEFVNVFSSIWDAIGECKKMADEINKEATA